MKEILILTDGKAGHENQSRAFARALGLPFRVVPVSFRFRGAKALSYLLDRAGTNPLFPVELPHPLPSPGEIAAVVGTGSGTFYAAKSLAKKLGVPSGAVLYPRGYRIGGFGCILAPSFDRPAERPNVIGIPVNLTAADSAFYKEGTEKFLSRYKPSAKPAAAVILGGPNKAASMTAQWAKETLSGVFDATPDCEHWITTSRRTPPEVEAVVDSFPFDYKLVYSRDRFNPIPAFVSLASRLFVSAESTGMLSEAVTYGSSAVSALDNLGAGRTKFRRFLEGLVKLGAADVFAPGAKGGSVKIDLSPQFSRAAALLGISRNQVRQGLVAALERRTERG